MNANVKASSFGISKRLLVIDGQSIQYDNCKFKLDDITAIRYWISSIEFYKFSIGRKYHIGLKTQADQIDIVFKSYLGLDQSYFDQICEQIIEEIWEPITELIFKRETEHLIKGEFIKFGHCEINKKGLIIKKGNLAPNKDQLITWRDLNFEKKYNRLVLNSISNPKIWTNIYYKDSWNIEILITLLNWIVKENGMAELEH